MTPTMTTAEIEACERLTSEIVAAAVAAIEGGMRPSVALYAVLAASSILVAPAAGHSAEDSVKLAGRLMALLAEGAPMPMPTGLPS